MSRIVLRATIERPVVDELPLSPELVLVSPPELAQRLRAALPDPATTAPVRVAVGPGRGEVAAVYAVSLAVTLVPLALALLAVPARP
jgi:hypothetical protein